MCNWAKRSFCWCPPSLWCRGKSQWHDSTSEPSWKNKTHKYSRVSHWHQFCQFLFASMKYCYFAILMKHWVFTWVPDSQTWGSSLQMAKKTNKKKHFVWNICYTLGSVSTEKWWNYYYAFWNYHKIHYLNSVSTEFFRCTKLLRPHVVQVINKTPWEFFLLPRRCCSFCHVPSTNYTKHQQSLLNGL